LELITTKIDGAVLLKPRVHSDVRGFFMESWNAETFAQLGLDIQFVQDNHSCSGRGVIRGLHYQLPDAQGKLVRVVHGAAYDVIVDLRRSSPTFGEWLGIELTAENQLMLWAPPGVAHGFLSLEAGTNLMYKCTELYRPASERCLLWNDPTIGIEWPALDSPPILAPKDDEGVLFAEAVYYP